MAGFFKNLFGSNDTESPPQRQLNHPRDLNVGDLVKFKLYAPPLIAGHTFKVNAVNTYDYKSGLETEFTLQGSVSQAVFMTIENTDEGSEVRLSVKQPRNIIEKLFDLDQFADIFDNESGPVSIERQTNPDDPGHALDDLQGWTAPVYHRQTFAARGYYHNGDYRNGTIPQDSDNCEELDYYGLLSDDEKHEVEIEIFDDDEDVLLTLVSDESIIEELWPGT